MERSDIVQDILDEREAVWRVNWILALCEFQERITSLRESTCSMFICMFESLYRVRVAGIRRCPRTKEDHLYNCTLLLDALANQVLGTDLSHIVPEKVVNGERISLENLIEIFFELAKIVSKRRAPPLPVPQQEDELQIEEESRSLSLSDSEDSTNEGDNENANKQETNTSDTVPQKPETPEELHTQTKVEGDQIEKTQQPKTSHDFKQKNSNPKTVTKEAEVSIHQQPIKPVPLPKRTQELRPVNREQSLSKTSSPKTVKTPLSSPNISPIPKKHMTSISNSFSAPLSHEKRHSNESPKREVKKVKVMSPRSSETSEKDEAQNKLIKRNDEVIKDGENLKWYRDLDKISQEHLDKEHQVQRMDSNAIRGVRRPASEKLRKNKDIEEFKARISHRVPKYVWNGPLSEWNKMKLKPDSESPTNIKRNLELEDVSKRKQELYKSVMKDFVAERRRSDSAAEKQKKLAWESALRERKFATIRMGKINEDYERDRLSKIVRRQSKEEQLYRKLFMGALKLQRSRIRQEKQHAKEVQKQRETRERDKFQELENHYLQQYASLAEKVAKEQQDMVIEDKAQREALRKLERDLKKTMERQIQLLRDHLNSEEEKSYDQFEA